MSEAGATSSQKEQAEALLEKQNEEINMYAVTLPSCCFGMLLLARCLWQSGVICRAGHASSARSWPGICAVCIRAVCIRPTCMLAPSHYTLARATAALAAYVPVRCYNLARACPSSCHRTGLRNGATETLHHRAMRAT